MKQMTKVTIDEGKCIGCELCCKDCISGVLAIRNGKAAVLSDQCLKCGHCIAICPQGAVAMDGLDMNEVKPYTKSNFGIKDDVLLNTLKFRRSIRHFTDRAVEKETLEKIIEAGRFTPTGSNKQNVRYAVVTGDIPLFEDEGLKSYHSLKRIAAVLSRFVKLRYDVSKFSLVRGFLFHGAPALILAISESDVNASLASMSMELMAEAMGLGTLYVGLFTRVANKNKTLRKNLGLSKKEHIVTCLALGYPAVKYLRTVPRNKASVEWR